MSEHRILLPDVGEGITEAEIVEWHVAVGDSVAEDELLGAVMTDKAAVDIPAPVAGVVLALGGDVGDILAVGAEYLRLSIAVEQTGKRPAEIVATPREGQPAATATSVGNAQGEPAPVPTPVSTSMRRANDSARLVSRPSQSAPLASPAVRRRAYEHGVALQYVMGSGPAGRISHADLDAFLALGTTPGNSPPDALQGVTPASDTIEEIKVIGLRRQIAERMQNAKRRIPHFSYVEETDVTTLEKLRAQLNGNRSDAQPKLSLLPFLVMALARSVSEFPQMNARYDDDAGIIRCHNAVHIGIATQTERGLLVPVVRHAEQLDIWGVATEIARLAEAARAGKAKREELTGATITITSLGALGGIASTPVINYPEVAIVGVNKIMTRPVFVEELVVPRKLMNLSSSFDHRVVDGFDAARFIQRVRTFIEFPSTIFISS